MEKKKKDEGVKRERGIDRQTTDTLGEEGTHKR